MKRKLSLLLFVLSFSLVMPSCIKDDITPLGDEGATFVKFLEGPEQKFFFDPFTDVKEVHVFTFRRDANSAASLQTAADVTVQLNDDLIDDYNYEHDTEFYTLPAEMYSIVADPGIVQSGNVFNIHFNPGEYSKNVSILMNGAMWEDISINYAMAFEVVNAGDLSVTDGKESIISFFSIKNEWDGIYTVVSGEVVRYTAGVPNNDALSGSLAGNKDVILATAGPTTLSVPPAGVSGGLYWAYGNNSMVAGIDGLRVNVDPDDNSVAMSSLVNLTLTNMNDNYYDPSTKTFYLSFLWNPTGNKRTYEVVLKYKGPRE